VLAVPYPILLVVVGSLAGFVPGMPHVTLDPDVVLFVLLPPLLYNAAYSSSLRDLRANARVITLSAVGLVAATTCLVAVAAHLAVPELPWAACFALGAIISPTDPLAATQIIRRLGLPSRSVTVVEGEALVNDGLALALYQTAVAAVGGTAFTVWQAGGLFLVEVAGGIAVGIGVALVMKQVFRYAGGDRLLWLVLSLATGYLAYLPAEQLGLSGFLATVTAGLVTGHRAPLISTASVRLSKSAPPAPPSTSCSSSTARTAPGPTPSNACAASTSSATAGWRRGPVFRATTAKTSSPAPTTTSGSCTP
jgi:monovalent cation/hydrogen antiporter